MRNTRALTVLALSLLTGLIAVVLGARWMNARATEVVDVAVAVRDTDAGSVLEPGSLRTVRWPAGSVPEGTFQDAAGLQGRVLKTALARGEPVLAAKLAPVGSAGGLSAVIAEGKRALTVRVNEVIGVAGFALPGSRVDVMVHARRDPASGTASGEDASVSRIVLEHILVLAVAQEASRDETRPRVANAVTLEVTPEQAELLDVARSVGTLSLVLRNPVDSASAATHGRAKADLFAGASAPAPIAAPARPPTPLMPLTPWTTRPLAPASPASPAPPAAEALRVEIVRGVSRTSVEVVRDNAHTSVEL